MPVADTLHYHSTYSTTVASDAQMFRGRGDYYDHNPGSMGISSGTNDGPDHNSLWFDAMIPGELPTNREPPQMLQQLAPQFEAMNLDPTAELPYRGEAPEIFQQPAPHFGAMRAPNAELPYHGEAPENFQQSAPHFGAMWDPNAELPSYREAPENFQQPAPHFGVMPAPSAELPYHGETPGMFQQPPHVGAMLAPTAQLPNYGEVPGMFQQPAPQSGVNLNPPVRPSIPLFPVIRVDGLWDCDFVEDLIEDDLINLLNYIMDVANITWSYVLQHGFLGRRFKLAICRMIMLQACDRQLSINPEWPGLEQSTY